MKNKIITTFFLLSSVIWVKAQTLDTLYEFAKSNEALFWKIVSKNYPFTKAEIEIYKEDINFYYLSANENISWTAEMIKDYESVLSMTYKLQRNKGIKWNENLIKEFVNRDWFDWSQIYYNREMTISRTLFEAEKSKIITTKYLVRETSDSLTFLYENEYDKPYILFQKYLRNWYSESDSSGVKHYPALKKYFGQSIKEVPYSILVEYKEDFNQFKITEFVDFNWTWKSFALLYPVLEEMYIPDNKTLYTKLFLPELDSAKLTYLVSKFEKKERYFELSKADDDFGSPCEIDLISNKNGYYAEDVYNFSDTFPKTIEPYIYKIRPSSEGPERFTDIMFFNNSYRFPGFVCSQKTKLVLESFDLPRHKFYPIKVYLESRWYKNDTANYFLFVTNNSSLFENLIVKSNKLSDTRLLFDADNFFIEDSLKITKISQFKKFIAPRSHYQFYKYNDISQIKIKKHFDVTVIDGTKIYISHGLKDALKEYNITGINFRKNYTINWIVPKIRKKIMVESDLLKYEDDKISANQQNIQLYLAAKDRQKSIASDHNAVKGFYEKTNLIPSDSMELKIREIEIKGNIVFPKEYRKYLLSGNHPKLGPKFKDYEFLPIDRLEQIGKDWYQNTPQTYRAVLIAENGYGDYLGLLMEEDSTFKLSNVLYQFEHETGEVIKIAELK